MSIGYLCGAMSCYKDTPEYEEKVIAWRKKIWDFMRTTELEVFDPTDIEMGILDFNAPCIVELNINKIKQSKCLIVNAENIEKSPGSIFELTYAFSWGIPVYWFGKLTTNSPHIKRILGINQYETIEELGLALNVVYGTSEPNYCDGCWYAPATKNM